VSQFGGFMSINGVGPGGEIPEPQKEKQKVQSKPQAKVEELYKLKTKPQPAIKKRFTARVISAITPSKVISFFRSSSPVLPGSPGSTDEESPASSRSGVLGKMEVLYERITDPIEDLDALTRIDNLLQFKGLSGQIEKLKGTAEYSALHKTRV